MSRRSVQGRKRPISRRTRSSVRGRGGTRPRRWRRAPHPTEDREDRPEGGAARPGVGSGRSCSWPERPVRPPWGGGPEGPDVRGRAAGAWIAPGDRPARRWPPQETDFRHCRAGTVPADAGAHARDGGGGAAPSPGATRRSGPGGGRPIPRAVGRRQGPWGCRRYLPRLLPLRPHADLRRQGVT